MVPADVADTGARAVPGGCTTNPPLSRSTMVVNRPPDTEEIDGSPEGGAELDTPPGAAFVHEHAATATPTSTVTRTRVVARRTAHSLPAARR